ncbi:MAG: hypothetical protein WCC48_05740 [Anaeromyxobacteraceae bacterium]
MKGGNRVKPFTMTTAVHIAIAVDCIRRGDLDAAAEVLMRAAELDRGAVLPSTSWPQDEPRGEVSPG